MSKSVRVIAILLAGGLAAACGHGKVARQFEFDGGKGYSLIAYDIYFIADTWPNYAVYLFPYDEETGAINPKKRIESGSGFVSLRKNEGVKFYLGTSNPGTYVIGFLFYQTEGKRTVVCFPEKTLKVTLEPGTVHYLGEMTFTFDHPPGVTKQPLELTAHDKAHVLGRLAEYPGVQAPIVVAPHTFVSFDPGEPKREGACIAGYTD